MDNTNELNGELPLGNGWVYIPHVCYLKLLGPEHDWWRKIIIVDICNIPLEGDNEALHITSFEPSGSHEELCTARPLAKAVKKEDRDFTIHYAVLDDIRDQGKQPRFDRGEDGQKVKNVGYF